MVIPGALPMAAAGNINEHTDDKINESANDVREANNNGASLLKSVLCFPIGLTMRAEHVRDNGSNLPFKDVVKNTTKQPNQCMACQNINSIAIDLPTFPYISPNPAKKTTWLFLHPSPQPPNRPCPCPPSSLAQEQDEFPPTPQQAV